jgi:hypothetical protein
MRYVDDFALFASCREALAQARRVVDRVRNHNLIHGRRRLQGLVEAVRRGRLSPEVALQSVLSWNAHLAHGHTIRLRRRLFAGVAFAADLP